MTDEKVTSEAEVDPKGETKPNGATESLDDILNEFDAGTKSVEKPKEEVKGGQDADARIHALEERERQRNEADQRRTAAQAVDEVISNLQEGLEVKLPKWALSGLLDEKAKDPRFVDAFLKRDQNLSAWNKLVGKLREEIHQAMKDSEQSDNRNAIAAAVRSASTKAAAAEPLSEKQIRTMSRGELYKQFPGLSKR